MSEINIKKLTNDIQETCRYHLEQVLLLSIYTRSHFKHFERNRKAIQLIGHAIDLLDEKTTKKLKGEEFTFIVHQLNKGVSSGALMMDLKEKFEAQAWLQELMLKMDENNLHFGIDKQSGVKKYCLLLQYLTMCQVDSGQSVIKNMVQLYEGVTSKVIQEQYQEVYPQFSKDSAMAHVKSRTMDSINNALWNHGFNQSHSEHQSIDFHSLYKQAQFKSAPQIDSESWYSDLSLTINENLIKNIVSFGYVESLGGWLVPPLQLPLIKQNAQDEVAITSELYKKCKAKPLQKISQFAKVIARIVEHDVSHFYPLNQDNPRVEQITEKGALMNYKIPQIKKGYQHHYVREETTRRINLFFHDCHLMDDWKKLESAEHRFKGKLNALYYDEKNNIREILTEQAAKIQESSIKLPRSNTMPLPLYIM